MQIIGQKFKIFLYPHFSEIDAFSFWLAVVMPFLFAYGSEYKLSKIMNNLGLGLNIYILAGFFGFWTYIVIKNIIIKNTINISEKRGMANYFYFFLGYITFFSALDFIFEFSFVYSLPGIFDAINLVFMVILLLRSYLSLAALRLTRRTPDLLIDRVKDVQINRYQILVLVCMTLLSYLFVKDYPFLSQVVLVYFYTDTAVKLLYKREFKISV